MGTDNAVPHNSIYTQDRCYSSAQGVRTRIGASIRGDSNSGASQRFNRGCLDSRGAEASGVFERCAGDDAAP